MAAKPESSSQRLGICTADQECTDNHVKELLEKFTNKHSSSEDGSGAFFFLDTKKYL